MKKNVVLVIMDCCRKKLVTPDIAPFLCDQAEKGVSYEQHYATSPWTLPSHTTMFTGLYTREHGVEHSNMVLPKELKTIAETFQENAYQTVGISNNPWFGPLTGLDKGFDYFAGVWYNKLRRMPIGLKLRQKVKKVLMEYSNFLDSRDSGAKRALSKIAHWHHKERDETKPYFMVVNFMELHHPYKPPEPFRSKYYKSAIPWMDLETDYRKINAYATSDVIPDAGLSDRIIDFPAMEMLCHGEMAYLDWKLEGWFNWMDDGNTIWIYTSDHGDLLGEEGGRVGHRFSLHRNLLHVPMIVYGDEDIRCTVKSGLTQHIGLYGSLLYFCDYGRIGFLPAYDHAFAEHTNPIPLLKKLGEEKFFTKEYVKEVSRHLATVLTEHDQVILSKYEGEPFKIIDGCSAELFDKFFEWRQETKQKFPGKGLSQVGLDKNLQYLRERGFF